MQSRLSVIHVDGEMQSMLLFFAPSFTFFAALQWQWLQYVKRRKKLHCQDPLPWSNDFFHGAVQKRYKHTTHAYFFWTCFCLKWHTQTDNNNVDMTLTQHYRFIFPFLFHILASLLQREQVTMISHKHGDCFIPHFIHNTLTTALHRQTRNDTCGISLLQQQKMGTWCRLCSFFPN